MDLEQVVKSVRRDGIGDLEAALIRSRGSEMLLQNYYLSSPSHHAISILFNNIRACKLQYLYFGQVVHYASAEIENVSAMAESEIVTRRRR